MRAGTLALIPLLAALPAAAALGLPGANLPPVPVVDATPPVSVQVPLPDASAVTDALPVPQVRVSVPALPLPHLSAPAAPAARATAPEQPSPLERTVALAQQASTPAFLTFLLSLYAAGLDGLRAFGGTRFGSGAGRVARLLARAAAALPLAGLFSRIAPDRLLEQPTRALLHDAVASEPGLTLQELQRRAGAGWGATVRHVERLERGGLLVSVHQGGKRLLFAANTAASRNRQLLAALAQPTGRAIALLVAERPGIDQVGVCAALGLRNPAASKQLARLAGLGLVERLRDGRRCLHHPTPALREALALLPLPPAVRVVGNPAVALSTAAAAA